MLIEDSMDIECEGWYVNEIVFVLGRFVLTLAVINGGSETIHFDTQFLAGVNEQESN